MVNSLTYNGQKINQRADGYVNLGELCATHGKKYANWSRLDSSQAYLEALAETLTESESLKYEISNLIIPSFTEIGGRAGTWGHPLVAVEVARWISPKFGIWLDVQLRGTIENLLNKLHSQQAQKDLSGFVYLAMTPNRWCKIGMSKIPYKRMSSLQTGTPLEVTLIHRVFTFNMSALEKALHSYFDAYWLRGEWFDLPEECIKDFPAIANELDADLELVRLPEC